MAPKSEKGKKIETNKSTPEPKGKKNTPVKNTEDDELEDDEDFDLEDDEVKPASKAKPSRKKIFKEK